MEPFKLTVQQVTFKEGEEGSEEFLNSFDTVINCNYDSQRDDDQSTNVLPYQQEFQNVKYTTCSLGATTHSVGIEVPRKTASTGYNKSSSINWYNYLDPVAEESVDNFVINADVNFSTSDNKHKPSVTDVSTIAQISSNSSAANHHIPYWKKKKHGRTSLTTALKTIMPSESETSPKMDPSPPILDASFETVAEALHLQRTVIGNYKLTPAPPDVVAQIVAEAERKLRAESESNGSISSLSDTSSLYSSDQTLSATKDPDDKTSVHLPATPTVESQFPDVLINKNNSNRTTQFTDEKEQEQPLNVSSPKELIRIPAQALSVTKEKGNKTDAARASHKSKEMPEGAKRFQHDKIVRKSSSERLVDQFNIADNKTFLESLSPVKNVDMTDFFPPRKLSSSSTETVPETQLDTNIVNKIHQTPPSFKPTAKENFVLPPLGPLFPNIPKPNFNVPRTPVPTPHIAVDDASHALKNQLDSVLREKARLEGQLEILTNESNSNLQERAELQAQLASLKLKLLARAKSSPDDKKVALKADLEEMRRAREVLEDLVADTQRQLEDKTQVSKITQEELTVTQDSMDKLHNKMKELRDTLSAKEMTIQALKNKIAELYVEVQNTLQSKSESDAEASLSKNDLTSLINAKEWYQQQLQLAHEVRCSLQKELTILQAQSVSQSSVVERLKMDNTKLRQQLTESQHKALKEKELLAKHLEAIQTDMMDREAAFREMQGEKRLIEESFDSQCKSVEDEYSRVSQLMQTTADLESQLDKAQDDAKKKQVHIMSLESHQIELEKRLTLSQEKINEKDGVIEDLNRKMIEVDEQLKAFQSGITEKDTKIMKLQEEKATVEIALSGALKEKALVDNALDTLKSNMGKVEVSFKQMRQELSNKVTELESVKSEKHEYSEEVDKIKKELEIKRRSYDTIHKDYDDKSSALNDIQIEKAALESQIKKLKKGLLTIEESSEQATYEQNMKEEQLNQELVVVKLKLEVVQQQLQEEITIKEKMHLVQQSQQQIKSENVKKEVKIQSAIKPDVIDGLSQTESLSVFNNQEQQTDLTVENLTKMENESSINSKSYIVPNSEIQRDSLISGNFPNLVDSSCNTDQIESSDTISEPVKSITVSEVNTDTVDMIHMDSQTILQQPYVSDAGSNTDKIESSDTISEPVKSISISEVNTDIIDMIHVDSQTILQQLSVSDAGSNTDKIESSDTISGPVKSISISEVNTDIIDMIHVDSQTIKQQLSVSDAGSNTDKIDLLHCNTQTVLVDHNLAEAGSNTDGVDLTSVDTQTIEKQLDTSVTAVNTDQVHHAHVDSQTTITQISIREDVSIAAYPKAGAKNVCQIDSSVNTDIIQNADVQIQTSEKQKKLSDSSNNTEVVCQTDSQVQTSDEPKVCQKDASINTDSTNFEHNHCQTEQGQGVSSLVQTSLKLSDVANLMEQKKNIDNNPQFTSNIPSAESSSQTDDVTEKSDVSNSSVQTVDQDSPVLVQVSSKQTNTDLNLSNFSTVPLSNEIPESSDILHDNSKQSCDNSKQDALQTENSVAGALKVSEATHRLDDSQSIVSDTLQQQSVIIEGVSKEIHNDLVSQNTSLKSKVVNLEDNLAFHRSEAKEVISKLNDNLLAVQTELKSRQSNYDQNVEVLGEKLRETFTAKQQIESEIKILQKKYEEISVDNQQQFKSQIEVLEQELNKAQTRVQDLETYLLALQESKNTEIIQLQQHITTLVEDIEQIKTEKQETTKTEELNQQLALELEKERGRLEGLVQNNSSLKQHVGQLEEALARRESSLLELQSHLQDTNKDKELTSEDYIKRVQSLETLLQKEKDSQRDLRKQIGVKITENKKLKKSNDEVKRDQSSLKQQVEICEQEVVKLQTELDNNRESSVSHQSEVQSLQSENRSLHSELEHIRRDLTDNATKNNLINEEMKSLEWQINQKSKEVEFTQEQLKLIEERQQSEIDLLKQTIAEKQQEIEELQTELLDVKQEKLNQKTRVTELRSALKSSVQYHKLTKKLNSKKNKMKKEEETVNEEVIEESVSEDNTEMIMLEKGVQVNLEDNVVIPAPTYDLDAIETLLEQTAIQTLESKPLDNLQSCLISLKSQINGLQMSMEVHTTNIHNSHQTAGDLEKEVHELQEVVRTVANTTFASITTNTKSISTEGAQAE